MQNVTAVQWVASGADAAPWARVFVDNFDGVILVRMSRRSGTREIVSLIVDGPKAGKVARELPTTRLEFLARQLPDLPCELDGEGGDATAVSRDELTDLISRRWNDTPQDAPGVYPAAREVRQPLRRPAGQDVDVFYRRVAEAYTATVAHTRAVAPFLADEAGVPVRTVHVWIREARRRGFLPPLAKKRP